MTTIKHHMLSCHLVRSAGRNVLNTGGKLHADARSSNSRNRNVQSQDTGNSRTQTLSESNRNEQRQINQENSSGNNFRQ